MTFGNVLGWIHIFDINKKKALSTHDHKFHTIYSLDFFQDLILVGDSYGNTAITDIR